jgi:uncharacterized sulfatase
MDERMDLVRSCRDGRYVYVHNFMPHRPHGQHNAYMFQTPSTRVWKKLFDDGKLTDSQAAFWKLKAAEELYDLQSDPDEVKNLASSPDHQAILARLRKATRDWQIQIRDVALIPEAMMHERAAYATPYDLGQDAAKYPLERVLETATLAGMSGREAMIKTMERVADEDPAVRYWAATGLLIRGADVGRAMAPTLRTLLDDKSPLVRIQAAETLIRFGPPEDAARALDLLADHADGTRHTHYVAVAALTAIDECGEAAAPIKAKLTALPVAPPNIPGSMREYIPRLLEHIGVTLGFEIKEERPKPAPRKGKAKDAAQ